MLFKSFASDIVFSGYYGELNTGDDAFVEVAAWGAEKYWDKTSHVFLGKKQYLPFINNEIRGFPLSFPKTYKLQTRLLVSSTNYFIAAGGSTLHSKMHVNNPKIIALNQRKKNDQLKIGAIGISIGPFNTIEDEKDVINYLKNIDFLAVRDQASYDFVSSLSLPYEPVNAFDLAALLPEIYRVEKKPSQSKYKVIGISICPVESLNPLLNYQKEKKRNAQLINLIKNLDRLDNIHFKFLIINGHPRVGDINLTKEIIQQSSPKSFELVGYQRETKSMWSQISSCDFIIATRLHAAIFACFSKTPFMLNEYHKKCTDFLNNIEHDDAYRLFNSDYSISKKTELILEIINNPNSYIPPKSLDIMRSKAELNFTGVKI